MSTRYDSKLDCRSNTSHFNSDKQRCGKNDQHLCSSGLSVCKIRTYKEFESFYFHSHFDQMTKRGIIAIVVSMIVCIFTPAGLYVYTIPFVIGCMGGKKVRKFYFNFFFESECKK